MILAQIRQTLDHARVAYNGWIVSPSEIGHSRWPLTTTCPSSTLPDKAFWLI